MTRIETDAPRRLADARLQPRGSVHPSPDDWRDQTLYFLLPDRFSNGAEAQSPRFDPRHPQAHRAPDVRAWMQAGKNWCGGTLKGIQSKLDYLRDLGVTALWIGPIWKQRAELDTYHGYGIQDFLDVDPHFGTRQDLRDLVDAAHARGLYVLLDIIYNHTGNNWFYRFNDQPASTLPYRYEPRYDVYGWRSSTGAPIAAVQSRDDGVFPEEFQNLDWYTRAGQIQRWDAASWEDPLHPDVEFRRGDFFDLKDLDLDRRDTLEAVIHVYRYWIALSDCDGFRVDTVKHITWDASRRFSSAIREYAESIGKERFWILGEVTGGEYMSRSYLEISGRNLDAVLDIGESRQILAGMVKGLGSPQAFFDQYTPHDVLGSHRETGRYHVSILDDHDMVGGRKQRFAAGIHTPARHQQVAHAVGTMLTTLGVPCIYYGTEQAFDGTQDRHDFGVEPNLGWEDRYVRETLFASGFGAFQTTGCHFFDPDHPVYLRIAALARVRNGADAAGIALRRGRQFLRELAPDGENFVLPSAGGLVGWSRIMVNDEVLVVLNTHGLEPRSALVTVDAAIHPAGSTLRVLYRGDWSDAQLKSPPSDETVPVQTVGGRVVVRVTLPPAGMLVLA